MKKTIAILLVAIVALGFVFADVTTVTQSGDNDSMKVTYNVGATNKLLWSATEVLDPNASDLADIESKEFNANDTYYATLITNSTSTVVLKVTGTAFKNNDLADSFIGVTYTMGGEAQTAISSYSGEASKEITDTQKTLRVISCPVSIAMDTVTRDSAPAGAYTATLTATVSSI